MKFAHFAATPLFAALCVAVSLSACGGGDDTAPAATTPPTGGTTDTPVTPIVAAPVIAPVTAPVTAPAAPSAGGVTAAALGGLVPDAYIARAGTYAVTISGVSTQNLCAWSAVKPVAPDYVCPTVLPGTGALAAGQVHANLPAGYASYAQRVDPGVTDGVAGSVILGADGSFTVKQGSFSVTTYCATVSGKIGTTAGCLVNQLTADIVMFSAIFQPDDRSSPNYGWTAAITLQKQANGTWAVMPTIGGYFQAAINDQATIPYNHSERNIYFH